VIEQSDINQLMQAGNEAFLSGKKEADNPYKHGDGQRLWLRGYANAKHMTALNDRYKG